MGGTSTSTWALLAGAVILSVALVNAFSAVDTGARTVTASVVTDGTAYLAIAPNAANGNAGFVSVDGNGVLSVAFDDGNADATGDGINPNSVYEFHSIIKVYNNGTASADLAVTISGTDAASCEAAFTAASDQSAATWATPTTGTLTVAKGGVAYLGLRLTAGATAPDTLDCAFQVATA